MVSGRPARLQETMLREKDRHWLFRTLELRQGECLEKWVTEWVADGI